MGVPTKRWSGKQGMVFWSVNTQHSKLFSIINCCSLAVKYIRPNFLDLGAPMKMFPEVETRSWFCDAQDVLVNNHRDQKLLFAFWECFYSVKLHTNYMTRQLSQTVEIQREIKVAWLVYKEQLFVWIVCMMLPTKETTMRT